LLRPRTEGALRAARAAGLHVAVVTGRMFRSVRPYLEQAALDEPVVCYQGAVVADPVTGRFLRHEPIPLELAREAIAAVQDAGFSLNCYVDDDLVVAAETDGARAYADFQHIPLNVVGNLLDWLDRPPTKLVVVDEPETLDRLKPELLRRFERRLFIAKSLPYFLELASRKVSKGSGMAFLAEHAGFTAERTVAFGDGENDLELLEWAGYAVAVANAHEALKERADWVIPGPDEEGVAQVIESLLDSRP
jgi:Cof subfamily protein (haloacid dehalogenase superfamily)